MAHSDGDAPEVQVRPDGSVQPDDAARETLGRRAGRFGLVVDLHGLLVLRGEHAPRVQMAGEILNRMTVMEVVNVIATSNWRGRLHIVGPENSRSLELDQGALKGARSDASADRLGEVLFRAGVLTREQVREIAQDAGNKRFGELAVERGWIDAQTLYQHLQGQVEEIFFASLLVAEGHFAFVVGDEEEEEELGTTVHLPVQALLMEGVQRIDEMALFRDKIPSMQLCPVPQPDVPAPPKQDEDTRRVLAACDGDRTIDDLARVTGLGEFGATKAVYHLLQTKQVVLQSPRKVDPDQVRQLVGRFNEVLQDIFVAVATYGGLEQTRATLDAWIQGSGYGPYFGGGVDDLGAIDPDHVAKALEGVDTEHPLEALHQALHELAAFALFSATTTLPRDQELALARDVNARLKAVRL
ncbi:MAG TPA: DUF4388 domain-containing protein [Polyangiaceae bacterium LLY-WYZ-15_(1-7)]|nr:hypothetical protein [Sandaracinus sp.]HJK93139.1 DUF4388 domain-containing protein [Polyangiaceae bacterium LLY-WYZ-15_(1-7)]MBJ74757.1 hypothetical protein [Sandaracinus sp.]HJL04282.1 DUF4388 domain-containing protein [Polyangiaceae bacterium LLY-WYZ-15_(1-7)]HJL10501.1 DUF4388 domain-containing protein [Polyangiaceae bacterium LLY-WYZ-15_(1-7)]